MYVHQKLYLSLLLYIVLLKKMSHHTIIGIFLRHNIFKKIVTLDLLLPKFLIHSLPQCEEPNMSN